jgi:hypothetical protein
VREALDARDGFKTKRRKKTYDLISRYASHVTYAGVKLTVSGDLVRVGPFVDENLLTAWLEELVKPVVHAAIGYGQFFEKVERPLLLMRAAYVESARGWRERHWKEVQVDRPNHSEL